jgi:hypothetical protein
MLGGLVHERVSIDARRRIATVWRDRDEVEARMVALVRDFLDSQAGSSGDDEIDVGHMAIVAEVKWRRTPDEIHDIVQQRERPEVGYTPEAEWTHGIVYRSSDSRDWVCGGLFRRAMLIADGYYDDDDDEDEDSG